MSYGLCQVCQADIIWALTLPGRNRMPVDPDRYDLDDDRANLVVSRDHLGSLIVRVITPDVQETLQPHQWRAMPHFATCRGRTHPPAAHDPAALAEYFPNVTDLDAHRTTRRRGGMR